MGSRTPARFLTTAAAALPLVLTLGCGGSDAGKPSTAGAPAASGDSQAPSSPAPSANPSAPPASPQGNAGAPGGQQAQAPSDSPVPPGVDPKKALATVNGKPIQAEKVYSVYQMNKMMLQQRGRTLNPTEDQMLKAQSLQVVIADELLYQAALQAGVKVAPAEVDAALKQWKSRVGSEENYKQFLESSGMTGADVRHELERNLVTEAYQKSLVTGKGVTEEEAKTFYSSNQEMFKVPELAHVQYILVKATDKEPESVRADAKKRAEEAQKRAAAGEDFGALAKQFSQDASAAKGGDIEPFPRGVMFPKFEEVAFSLKPDAVSAVFETPKGFNVLKLIALQPPSIRPFDDVKAQLMLEMSRFKEQNVVQGKIQELSTTAKIAVLDSSFAMPPPPEAANVPPGVNPPPGSAPARKAPAKQ
jgi:parvulin-like peptidyl-prolyl isomerase